MSAKVYKKIEITGTSTKSQEDAIENAVERAAKTVHNMRWFEVTEQRGEIQDGKVTAWQATVKIGFKLNE